MLAFDLMKLDAHPRGVMALNFKRMRFCAYFPNMAGLLWMRWPTRRESVIDRLQLIRQSSYCDEAFGLLDGCSLVAIALSDNVR